VKSVIKNAAKSLIGPVHWADLKYYLGRLQGKVDKDGFYDHLTRKVIQRSLEETSVCIDVGCNRGDILKIMMYYAPKGRFLAFEPLPDLYKDLVHSFAAENIKLYDIALSNSRGNSTFNYVISDPGYSGFKKRHYDKLHEDDKQIIVKTDLLDNIVHDEERISFIKVDVEGAELQVFLGAQKTIKRNKPMIIFEFGLGGADVYGTTPEDVYDLLCMECGLKISLLDNWLCGRKPLSRERFHNQFYKQLNYYFAAHP